jgi:hypothetical protein
VPTFLAAEQEKYSVLLCQVGGCNVWLHIHMQLLAVTVGDAAVAVAAAVRDVAEFLTVLHDVLLLVFKEWALCAPHMCCAVLQPAVAAIVAAVHCCLLQSVDPTERSDARSISSLLHEKADPAAAVAVASAAGASAAAVCGLICAL